MKKKPSGTSNPAKPQSVQIFVPFLKRNHYFYGQLLTERDLTLEQNYFREKQRVHNQNLFGWGVVSGLKLSVSDHEIVISPGMALDAYGREIVVPLPVILKLPKAKCPWYVILQYAERETDPVPVLSDGDQGVQNSRIEEGAEMAFSSTNPCSGQKKEPCGEPHPICIGKVAWKAGRWRIGRSLSSRHRPTIGY
jgi:hypothetical protein